MQIQTLILSRSMPLPFYSRLAGPTILSFFIILAAL